MNNRVLYIIVFLFVLSSGAYFFLAERDSVLAATTVGTNFATDGNITFSPGANNIFQITATGSTLANDGVINMDVSSATSSNYGMFMNYTANSGATGTLGGINVQATQNSGSGNTNLFGITVADLIGTKGSGVEAGVYVAGQNWEYGIASEAPSIFTAPNAGGGGDTASTRLTIMNPDTSLTTNQTLLKLWYIADVSSDSKGKFLELVENNRTHVAIDKGGNTTWSLSPGSQFSIEPYAPGSPLEPTVDIMDITNVGNSALTSTTGVDALSLTYVHGANAANISGSAIDITLQMSSESGDTIRGINVNTIGGSSEKEYGIVVGSGYDLGLQVNAPVAFNDSGSVVSLGGSSTITVDRAYIRVAGSGGAVTGVTAASGVSTANGGNGQILVLEGTSDTNTVRVDNTGIMKLAGAANKTLGVNDTLTLIWNGTNWLQLAFTDN